MCTFQILWQDGPHVGKMDKVQCENIYLLQFSRIASHPVLKEAAKFFKGKTCSKSRDPLNKEVNNEMIETSDLGFASNSSSASLVDPSKDEPREISKDRLIIAEDENGFIVMKIQKASDF